MIERPPFLVYLMSAMALNGLLCLLGIPSTKLFEAIALDPTLLRLCGLLIFGSAAMVLVGMFVPLGLITRVLLRRTGYTLQAIYFAGLSIAAFGVNHVQGFFLASLCLGLAGTTLCAALRANRLIRGAIRDSSSSSQRDSETP